MVEPKRARCAHRRTSAEFVTFKPSWTESVVRDKCVRCGHLGDPRPAAHWEHDGESANRTCTVCRGPHLPGPGAASVPSVECVAGLAERVSSLETDLKDLVRQVDRIRYGGDGCC